MQRPSVETLFAIAQALDRNPLPLLIVGGSINEDEARRALRDLIARACQSGTPWAASEDIEVLPDEILAPSCSWQEVVRLAKHVFAVAGGENESPQMQTYDQVSGGESMTPEFRQLLNLWGELNFERREKVIAYVEDQVALSRVT